MKHGEYARCYNTQPLLTWDNHGEIQDTTTTLNKLYKDIELITNHTYWELTTHNLQAYQEHEKITQNNTIGRLLGITIPQEHKQNRAKGNSRLDALLQDRTIRELRSWNERIKATKGTSTKYISQGWRRTANTNKPKSLKPKISLSSVDKQYAKITQEKEEELILSLIIQGEWHHFLFTIPEQYRNCKKIALPDIFVNTKGKILFSFPCIYDYTYSAFSEEHVIGIDVGINHYVTATVINLKTKEPIMETTLSHRVNSLASKVRKANTQVKSLQMKGRSKEARYHREANSRRKKALALLAAQELAELSYKYGNALIGIEDLSWVRNTMQNGRWNRGEFVKKLEEQVESNGGRVMRVSARNTSQNCSRCGTHGYFLNRVFHCANCDLVLDRDVNASVNIGLRVPVLKSVKTRRKAKRYTHEQVKRSRNGSGRDLKYPGRDRTKNQPTPKRKKKEVRVDSSCSVPVKKQESIVSTVRKSPTLIPQTVTSSTPIITDTIPITKTE